MGRGTLIPCFGLLVVFISYLCLGALLFSKIEGPKEEELSKELVSRISLFLETNECVNVKELEDLVDVIITANEFGVSWSYHINATSPSSWDFWSSLFFTTTLLTTIGYGHVTPLGYSGKLFCLFYALAGVPLTLLFLSMLMTMLHRLSKKLYKLMNEHLGFRQGFAGSEIPIKILHLSAIILIFAFLFVIIPSIVFLYLEPTWTYLDCYYFIFISLTTIGLGDFIPANDMSTEQWNPTYRALYQTVVAVYLVMGLGFVLLIIELFVTIPAIRSKLNVLYGSEEDDDDHPSIQTLEHQELSQMPFRKNGYSSMESESILTETNDPFNK